MARSWTLWLLVAGLLAAAAPVAQAAPVEVARMPASDVAVAGGDVAFLSIADGRLRVMRAAPGAAPVVLLDLPADPAGPTLRATPTRVALHLERGATTTLDAGPVGGPLERMFECSGLNVFHRVSTPRSAPFDLDGDRLAYIAHPCPDGPGDPEIVVRDLAAPGAPVVDRVAQPKGSFVYAVELAGRYVAAYNDTDGLTVHDLAADAPAYRPAAVGQSFSLQADGKLATGGTNSAGGICAIAWHSPAQPEAHSIPGACPQHAFRLAGDRIVYHQQVIYGNTRKSAIEVAGLDGNRRVLARLGWEGASGHEPDTDGARVAYTVPGCTRANDTVVVDDLAPADPAAEIPRTCPVRLTGKPLRASAGGLVDVRVLCKSGCRGTLDLTRGGASIVKRPAEVATDGGAVVVPLRLRAAVRRELRRRGTLSVSIAAATADRANARQETRRRTRLLAPR